MADDVRDVVATAQALGKPAGRDRDLPRPSSASELGLGGAIEYFDRLVGALDRGHPGLRRCRRCCARWCAPNPSAWCRRTACATWRWLPSACRLAAGRPSTRPSVAQPDASARGWLARWRERWCAWRDRRLTSPEFQRRAARTWYLRPLVRRRARALFDLVAGFVYSQVLLACVRVRAFEILAEGPQTAAALARALRPAAAGHRAAARAAVSLDLVEHRSGGRYGLGELGAPLVGNEAVAAMVEHHAVLYADLRDPLALLRGQGEAPALSRYWAYAEAESPGDAAARRGRRLLGADVGVAAAGGAGDAGRLSAAAATAACSTWAAARAASWWRRGSARPA